MAWRDYQVDTVQAMWSFMNHYPYEVVNRGHHGDALIDRSRSILATDFLAGSCEVMLCVDSDIVFRHDEAYEVCCQARDGYHIVAGIYTTRGQDHPHPSSHLAMEPVVFAKDPTPVPIVYPAGGFVAVHRKVFEAVLEREELPLCGPKTRHPFYPFYTPFVVEDDAGDPLYLSEDWAFFERARRAGFPSYANPAVRLLHQGVYAYRLEDMVTDRPPPCAMTIERKTTGGYHAETGITVKARA